MFFRRKGSSPVPTNTESSTVPPPNTFFVEVNKSELSPELLRTSLVEHGAIMIRGATNPNLLSQILQSLGDLLGRYSAVSQEELDSKLNSSDPIEKDFWQQLRLGHVFDRTFKPETGISYFDIIRQTGIWNLTEQAFPECSMTESVVANCRRMTDTDFHQFWDRPIDFHVDSQFFYDDKLSINFWTPLVPCGKQAPGLKVVALGIDDTRKYLEYKPEGYEPGPEDIDRMYKFRCQKMKPENILTNNLINQVWAPLFDLGDILAFTNFTMHGTHHTPEMIYPRTSVEVRVDLHGYQFHS